MQRVIKNNFGETNLHLLLHKIKVALKQLVQFSEDHQDFKNLMRIQIALFSPPIHILYVRQPKLNPCVVAVCRASRQHHRDAGRSKGQSLGTASVRF